MVNISNPASRDTKLSRACLATIILCAAAHATAQTYPAKPVRFVVPYPPGGPTDILARAMGQKLTESLGQNIIIDNRAGAGGTIGAEVVARSPADGYTMVWATPGTHGIAPSLYPKLAYDPVKDFAPVTLIALGTNVLVVHPSVPAPSVAALIALAKSRPGKLNFSSAGNGATSHMAGEMLKTMAGIDMTHIPFKGAAPAIVALLGGEVDLAILDIPALLPHIRAGKLRALAVASQRRSRVLPELPTLAESGLAGFNASSWHGLLAPANTPRDIVTKLHAAITQIIKLPDIAERLAAQGVEPVANTPEQFATFINDELVRWARVAKLSRAKAD